MSHIKELSHDFTRGIIFGAGLSVGIGAIVFSSIVFAAPSGGKFGEALNAILASNDWTNPGDGTVKNALTLSGVTNTSNLMRIGNTNECPTGQAINKIDTAGNISCFPLSTAP